MQRIYLNKAASYITKGGSEAHGTGGGFYNFPKDRAAKLVAEKAASFATDANEIVEGDSPPKASGQRKPKTVKEG